jgi:protocatechuate 3,4-dioxygenase, beta subunit
VSSVGITPYEPNAYDDHPPFSFADYRSTAKRARVHDMVGIVATLSEVTGPGPAWAEIASITDADADLITNAGTGADAIGSRTIVTGHVRDVHGRPVAGAAIDIWQANASGRYVHWRETGYEAALDPNFLGAGRCVTDADGVYRFRTVRPGPYPWGNHLNAWRPAHIHLSLWGPAVPARLVTQMYFEGDPLLSLDPIFHAVPAHSRDRLVACYAHDVSIENDALGYRFDIVINGPTG